MGKFSNLNLGRWEKGFARRELCLKLSLGNNQVLINDVIGASILGKFIIEARIFYKRENTVHMLKNVPRALSLNSLSRSYGNVEHLESLISHATHLDHVLCAERQGSEEGESAAGLLHPLTHSATHSRDWRDLQLRNDSLHSWEHTGCHLPASASSHHVDSATQNLARLVWALQP